MDGNEFECEWYFKHFCMMINDTITCNNHIDYICGKAWHRIYFLIQVILWSLSLHRSPTNAWYPVGSGTCISNYFKPYIVIATIFDSFTWCSNIWKEILSWMGFMNGIYEWDIHLGFAIVILVFLHCLTPKFAWHING